MPRLTRWYIRSALVYLAAGLLAGIFWALRDSLDLPAWSSFLWPVYLHFLTVGWLTQLIFAVAYWMFPRHSKRAFHGSLFLAWSAFIMINVGLPLRALAEAGHVAWAGVEWGSLLAASAALQWLAGMAFVANTWTRVRER